MDYVQSAKNYVEENKALYGMNEAISIEHFGRHLQAKHEAEVEKLMVEVAASERLDALRPKESIIELDYLSPVPPYYIVLNVIVEDNTTTKLLIETCRIKRVAPYPVGALITLNDETEDALWGNKLHVTNSFAWLCSVLCAAIETDGR